MNIRTPEKSPGSSPNNNQANNGEPNSGHDHWMSRMLSPDSIALVGASGKPESLGQKVLKLLTDNFYPGRLLLVNPRYESIDGLPCYPDLLSLPQIPDLVVMVIGNHSMEASVREAVDAGAGGVVIFANNYLENDSSPGLLERLKMIAKEAALPICGGNGMGFYNYDADTLVSFDFPPARPSGHIAFIAHSGSAMTYLANTDPRLMFNLVVSPGQEISGTVADYMLYALQQSSTRVLAVFAEAIRDPEKFVQALQLAQQKSIPVVMVKVGATEKSARMAASHSGAVAGNDAAFQAVCDRYGVLRVNDMDELAATALIFSQAKRPGSGGLSSLLDSGGLREQMIDLSEDKNVVFSELTQESKNQLGEILEFGLIAENPVDAMGAINADVAEIYSNVLRALNDDPNTGILSLEFEFRDGFSQYPQLLDVALASGEYVDKPFVMINSTTNVSNAQDAIILGERGIPVINGISLALSAIGNMFRYRDFQFFGEPSESRYEAQLTNQWIDRIRGQVSLDEVDALTMLGEFELPAVSFSIVNGISELTATSQSMHYPVVLKSAQLGLQHKSEVGGVCINLTNQEALSQAYTQMSARLGSRCIVAPMVSQGVELGFGMVNDAQFGPMVMVSAGGIYIELLDDRKFIPAPCSIEEAHYHIKSLSIYKILKGARGKPPCRVDLAAKALSDFSYMAYQLREVVSEIDLNPVIVTPEECVIVDALVIGR